MHHHPPAPPALPFSSTAQSAGVPTRLLARRTACSWDGSRNRLANPAAGASAGRRGRPRRRRRRKNRNARWP